MENENIIESNRENFGEDSAVASMMLSLAKYLTVMYEAELNNLKVFSAIFSRRTRKTLEAIGRYDREYHLALNDAIAFIYKNNRFELTHLKLEEQTTFVLTELNKSVSEYIEYNPRLEPILSYFNNVNASNPKKILNTIRQVIFEIDR